MNRSSPILFFLTLATMSPAVAETYRETVLAGKPAVYWQFENATENTVRDAAGLADSRAIRTGPGRRGVAGLAAAFDRSRLNSRIESDLNREQNLKVQSVLNGTFTLEFWLLDDAARPDSSINYSLLYKADAGRFTRNSLWLYRARQDGHYHFRIHGRENRKAGLTIRNPAGDSPEGDRQWHHVAVTADRSGRTGILRGWLDGQQVAQAEFDPNLKIDNAGPLIVGNGVHLNSPWEGSLDEFAIYPRVLNAEILQRHHAAGRDALKQSPQVRAPRIAREEFFELKIRPLLVEKCADCHSGEPDSESVLAINSRQALLAGGEFGPAIVPGHSEDSLLLHAVRRIHKEVRMPPDKADALPARDIAALARWIDDGAVWPSDENIQTSPDPQSETEPIVLDSTVNWALLPRREVPPPAVDNPRWMVTEIDRFLEKQRTTAGLSAVTRADRGTLIRRATFDLTGLPPTPAEVREFLTDPAADQAAFTAVIDRLLASRHYGERAGRLWLDVARYADTQGDVGDIPVQSAWLYRNWVIDSLNRDLPFDRFIQAQIAGDLLAQNAADEQTARGLTVATGFISLSRRFGNTKRDDIHLTIEDTIDTIGRGILGLTLRCARCHNHKFDPIRQADYYGLYGIFESTVYPWMGMSNEKSPSSLSPAIPNPADIRKASQYWTQIASYEYQINNHFRPWLKPTLDEFQAVSKQIEAADRQATRSPPAGQRPVPDRQKLESRRDMLLSRHDGRFRDLMLHGLAWIKAQKKQMAENPGMEFVFAVSEGSAHDARIHRRGNPRQLGVRVPRRFLQAIDGPVPPQITSGSGRLELAHWLTQPDHPLTARVIVNRIWQQHFGRGLVATADNFGRQGSRPSHPDLLDWLAGQFVQTGWSLKNLHRRIMLSESYQLTSSVPADNPVQKSDPDNRYLTRFRRRRLDAESIRDSLLAVSGQLDRSPGKAHAIAPWYASRFSLNNPFHAEPVSRRRSVYLLTQRLFRHSFLGLFDAPDRNTSTSIRNVSNIPSQALFLMNSSIVKEQAEALAARLEQDSDQVSVQLLRLYQLALSRDPDPRERASLLAFLASYRAAAEQPATTDGPSPELTALCRAVLTGNEFFFID